MIHIKSGIHRFVTAPDYTRLHQGYPACGPQDRYSCCLANRLVGNTDYTGAIEFSISPATLHIDNACHVLVGGAPCEITVNGKSQPEWTVLHVERHSEIQLRIGQLGCRVYLCIAGGLNDKYRPVGDTTNAVIGRSRIQDHHRWAPQIGHLRILPGTESNADIISQLAGQAWSVSPQSSGMGLRLNGRPLRLSSYNINSSPVQDGTIQATENGLLVLLRERGTLGGYPRVATVIDCDVDRLAQFRPRQSVQFMPVTQSEALQANQLWHESLNVESR